MIEFIGIALGTRVLVVEDRERRRQWFAERLPDAELVDTARLGLEALARRTPDVCFLDYHLHGFTSRDVAKYLAAEKFSGMLLVHSTCAFGADVLMKILPGATKAPFGTFDITRTRRSTP